jgi:hypothetical protein
MTDPTSRQRGGGADIGKRVNVKPKLMSGHETQWGSNLGLTDRLLVGRNVTLTHELVMSQLGVVSSREERRIRS